MQQPSNHENNGQCNTYHTPKPSHSGDQLWSAQETNMRPMQCKCARSSDGRRPKTSIERSSAPAQLQRLGIGLPGSPLPGEHIHLKGGRAARSPPHLNKSTPSDVVQLDHQHTTGTAHDVKAPPQAPLTVWMIHERQTCQTTQTSIKTKLKRWQGGMAIERHAVRRLVRNKRLGR